MTNAFAKRALTALPSTHYLAMASKQIPSITSTNLLQHRPIHNGQHDFDEKSNSKNILILGSHEILGNTIATQFKSEWNVLSADVVDPSHHHTEKYISLPSRGSIADLSLLLYRGVSHHLGKKKLDAIIVASGGWGGDIDPDIQASVEEEEHYVKEASEVAERMMRLNYFPVVAGSLVGQRLLGRNG